MCGKSNIGLVEGLNSGLERLKIKTLPLIVSRGVHLAAKPVIVGIDTGATTGLAILDLEGQLLLAKSKKNFRHSEISKVIYSIGTPVMMASDRSPMPKTIEKISASFPSKNVWPKQSLSHVEKNDFVRSYRHSDGRPAWANRHERDALAAAIFAHKKIKALMKKIKAKTRSEEEMNFVATEALLNGRRIDESVKDFNRERTKYNQ